MERPDYATVVLVSPELVWQIEEASRQIVGVDNLPQSILRRSGWRGYRKSHHVQLGRASRIESLAIPPGRFAAKHDLPSGEHLRLEADLPLPIGEARKELRHMTMLKVGNPSESRASEAPTEELRGLEDQVGAVLIKQSDERWVIAEGERHRQRPAGTARIQSRRGDDLHARYAGEGRKTRLSDVGACEYEGLHLPRDMLCNSLDQVEQVVVSPCRMAAAGHDDRETHRERGGMAVHG